MRFDQETNSDLRSFLFCRFLTDLYLGSPYLWNFSLFILEMVCMTHESHCSVLNEVSLLLCITLSLSLSQPSAYFLVGHVLYGLISFIFGGEIHWLLDFLFPICGQVPNDIHFVCISYGVISFKLCQWSNCYLPGVYLVWTCTLLMDLSLYQLIVDMLEIICFK